MKQKPIWFSFVSIEEIQLKMRQTLSDQLGIEFTEIGDSYLIAKMPVDNRTLQSFGILHGGASAALAETVASVAANGCVDLEKKLCVGVELNINHIRSVQTGFVTAIAKPFHLGKTTQVWEIRIENESKKLIAISRLTLAVIDRNRPLA